MEFTFRSRFFEVCVRTCKMYVVSAENILGPAINVRIGKTVWTTSKGLRKLGA